MPFGTKDRAIAIFVCRYMLILCNHFLFQEGKTGTLAELKVTTQAPIPRLTLLQPQVPVGGATPPIVTRPVVQSVALAVSGAVLFLRYVLRAFFV